MRSNKEGEREEHEVVGKRSSNRMRKTTRRDYVVSKLALHFSRQHLTVDLQRSIKSIILTMCTHLKNLFERLKS